MGHLHAAMLLDGELARVADVACTAPRSGRGEEEWAPRVQLIAPRRGVFVVHRGRDVTVADPTTAVLLGAGEEYRVSHPVDGGDRCTAVSVAAELAEELFGARRSGAVRLDPAAQLALGLLPRRLARAEPLEAHEAVLAALASAAAGAAPATRNRASAAGAAPAPRGRARVREVRALLASDPARPWRLADVARAVGVSPFHLARQFRAETGESVGRHLLRLRLGLALDRLADGADDLARLAVDLGFSHHSHFTARFRAVFGTTPSSARS